MIMTVCEQRRSCLRQLHTELWHQLQCDMIVDLNHEALAFLLNTWKFKDRETAVLQVIKIEVQLFNSQKTSRKSC